jgi:hypothetical protein
MKFYVEIALEPNNLSSIMLNGIFLTEWMLIGIAHHFFFARAAAISLYCFSSLSMIDSS